MKYLILAVISLFVFKETLADCRVKEASQMIREVETSPISKLSKSIGKNSCHVQYNIVVDGEEHTVKYNLTGESSGEKMCAEAIERGKSELLVSLAGKYRTEVVTTCSEGGELTDKPVRIGEVVLENELLPVERQTGYFKHNNSKCRLFRERYVQKEKLRVNHGVICQVNDNDWVVVDKW